jgi:periplasmic copper chaperone A
LTVIESSPDLFGSSPQLRLLGRCRHNESRNMIMFKNNSARRRMLARIGAGIAAAVAAVAVMPGLAQAHVTVQPGSVEGGDFSLVAFRVPNERDDASTTQVRVTLPKDQPIGSVQTTAMPGWKISTASRQLDKPIEVEGEKLTSVVSEVTWTAAAGGIRPGQFQDFQLSLGQLPESGKMVFNAVQTYSNGEKVNWNQVSTDPSVEPEHPAPVLTITPAAAENGAAPADQNGQPGQHEQAAPAAQSDSASNSILPLVVSGGALVLSVIATVLAWRAGRRPAPSVEKASTPHP